MRVLAALWAVLALGLAAKPDGGQRDGGLPDGGGADAGVPDGDSELLEHLDELEDLELLQNLGLFEGGTE